MKRSSGKSHCPINYTLEIIGDPWSLLILRDLLILKKRRFKDFLHSEERIATNVLTDRLLKLEYHGLIEKICEQYLPTQKGLDLYPLLIEMALWGSKHDEESASPEPLKTFATTNPDQFRKEMQKFL